MRNTQLSTKLSHQLWHTLLKPNYNSLHSSPFPKRPKLPLSHPLFAMINCEALWHIHPIKGPLYTEDHYHEKFLSAWLSAPTLHNSTIPPTTHTQRTFIHWIFTYEYWTVYNVNNCVKNKSYMDLYVKLHEFTCSSSLDIRC